MSLTSSSANRKDISTANRGINLEHRHFSFIAASLAKSKPGKNWDPNKMAHWESIVRQFADDCRATNSRFDRSRFLAACGVED